MINLFNYIDRPSMIHRLTGACKLVALITWTLAAMTTFYTPLLAVMTVASFLLLRLVMFFVSNAYLNHTLPTDIWLTVLSLVVYILYVGIAMNIILAIFNLIPIPPFDGSRIFYAFLPQKWYFGVMRYEQYIMIGCIILFFGLSYLGLNPLGAIENWLINGLFKITGMGSGTRELGLFNYLLSHLGSLVYAA